MAEITKPVAYGGTSLCTTLPSHNHMIGPFGDQPGISGFRTEGAGEDIAAGDLCFINSSGKAMRAIEDQTGTTAAVNDVQTMAIDKNILATVNGGNYILGYKGVYTTTPLLYTDVAATVQTAVQALSTVGAGNITVSGSFPSFVFTAASGFAGTLLELIEVDSSLTTDTNSNAVLYMTHTTPGKPIGASGAEQASSRVRGIAPIKVRKGGPITLYDACVFNYSDGNLTPGADVFLSGAVFGGIATSRSLAVGVQNPVGFAMDTQRVYFFSIR